MESSLTKQSGGDTAKSEPAPSEQFKLCLGYKLGLRMGDLAGCRSALSAWKHFHPEKYLNLYLWTKQGRCVNSRHFDFQWLFGDVADRVHVNTHDFAGADLVFPPQLNAKSIDEIWKTSRCIINALATKGEQWTSKLNLCEAGKQFVQTLNLPAKYVAVQPLMDAPYNGYRNAPASWWRAVIHAIADRGMPVVPLGLVGNMKALALAKHPNIHEIWPSIQNPNLALYVTGASSVFVGGETGFPLWAAMMGVPVVSTLYKWGPGDGYVRGVPRHVDMDFRPIAVAAPVRFSQLNGSPDACAEEVYNLFHGITKESTPY